MFMQINTKYRTNSFFFIIILVKRSGGPQVSQDIPCYPTPLIHTLNAHK